MTEYLIELYAPRGSAQGARRLAGAVAASGGGLRYVQTILVPRDETCFCLLEAPSESAVAGVAAAAGVALERIAEAITR